MKYTEDKFLPRAIIVDIDGTLAERVTDRSPYDWKRVGEDAVKGPIRDLVNLYFESDTNKSVILFSGRDSVCRKETEDWLSENDVRYNSLYMRPAGNNENDAIIKKRLFEENVRGQFYIDFWIDDRQRVVDMIRGELGLTCLQVDYGNF